MQEKVFQSALQGQEYLGISIDASSKFVCFIHYVVLEMGKYITVNQIYGAHVPAMLGPTDLEQPSKTWQSSDV